MELALDECRRMNISLPNLALVHQFYKSLVAHGEGRLGTQSLVKALQRMNNININA